MSFISGDDFNSNSSLTLSALSISLTSFIGLVGTGSVLNCGTGLITEGTLRHTMSVLR